MKTRDRWKGGLVCSKLFFSLLGCSGLCASLLGQNTYNLPQVANGTGIQTTFIFFNNADCKRRLRSEAVKRAVEK